jgi:mannosyltransferase OCH1-like enzyme
MKTQIPKIIHQIWSGIDEPLPKIFEQFGETWKRHYPDWKYEYWDNTRINNFIQMYYPQYWERYNQFSYNVQRWDTIRYFILDKIGGMYVDFDSESIEPMDKLLENKICCFSMEPLGHWKMYNRKYFFNNALMASVPNHPFIKQIIHFIFDNFRMHQFIDFKEKGTQILESTGPTMLVNLYEQYPEQEDIYLIPFEYVSPLTNREIGDMLNHRNLDEVEEKLKNAYSIHYFFNTWLTKKFA